VRARDIKNKSIHEGVLDAAYDVYKTSKLGQQRGVNAAAKSAETKFAVNISTLIARAMLSGTVIQQANAQPAASRAEPDADRDRLATGTNESKHYQIFDTLLEALIDEAPGDNPAAQKQIKPGSIQKLVTSYINQIVAQYRWQPNPELQAHSAQLAGEIEEKLSNSQTLQQILREKGTGMVNSIQKVIANPKVTANPTSQLFNTLYQWEQVGQSPETKQAAQQTQQTTQKKAASDDGSVASQFSSAEERQQLMKLAKFFNNAASDPSVFDDADYRPYRDAIEILASKLK